MNTALPLGCRNRISSLKLSGTSQVSESVPAKWCSNPACPLRSTRRFSLLPSLTASYNPSVHIGLVSRLYAQSYTRGGNMLTLNDFDQDTYSLLETVVANPLVGSDFQAAPPTPVSSTT